MKKYIAIILSLVMLFSASACGKLGITNNADKLTIVTTIFPLYDFARQIAGDKADVYMLLPAGAEAHSYEPTMQDIIKIKESDLFINIGGSADPWTEKIVNDAGSVNILSVINEIDDINKSGFELDEHVWTSVENAENIVDAIEERLSRIDPKNKSYYERNEERYSDKLDNLDEKFERVARKADKRIVFADRFPFKHFTDEYNLSYYAAFPGCSDESEPSAASVSELISIIKSENIKVVLYTETSNQQLADAICEETGAKKMLFHSCHSVGKEELENGVTYIDLMENNLEALKEALVQ